MTSCSTMGSGISLIRETHLSRTREIFAFNNDGAEKLFSELWISFLIGLSVQNYTRKWTPSCTGGVSPIFVSPDHLTHRLALKSELMNVGCFFFLFQLLHILGLADFRLPERALRW